jgi:hypothetical protein
MRTCKYGERINGKCPPKPKTKTKRACKYGKRVNGKCPPKPRATQTQKRGRPCKYGERINGKCPPKPKNVTVTAKKVTPILESTSSSVKNQTVNVELIMYENGKRLMFDQVSGNELESITLEVADMLGVYDTNIVFRGEEEEEMVVRNVEYSNKKIGNRPRKYTLMEKIPVELRNFGLSKWGKVEFMFKLA